MSGTSPCATFLSRKRADIYPCSCSSSPSRYCRFYRRCRPSYLKQVSSQLWTLRFQRPKVSSEILVLSSWRHRARLHRSYARHEWTCKIMPFDCPYAIVIYLTCLLSLLSSSRKHTIADQSMDIISPSLRWPNKTARGPRDAPEITLLTAELLSTSISHAFSTFPSNSRITREAACPVTCRVRENTPWASIRRRCDGLGGRSRY